MSRRTSVLSVVLALVLGAFVAGPAHAAAPDQIRWNGASIWQNPVPAQRVQLDIWSSTPASRLELLRAGVVVAGTTAVRTGPDHWAGTVSVDLTGLSGQSSLTMRVTPTAGAVRVAEKAFVATAPDQIHWNGTSVWQKDVPAQRVTMQVWSATPASRIELLRGGTVVGSTTTVTAKPDHWVGDVAVDLTGLSGRSALTMRVTPQTGAVRLDEKPFTVTVPDQIRFGGAALGGATVPATVVPLDLWSATPASRIELLRGSAVIAGASPGRSAKPRCS